VLTALDVIQPKVDEERAAGARFFMGKPDRWYETPHWRCDNGHVSTWYIKSEALRDSVCPSCRTTVWLTFPEDKEMPASDDDCARYAAIFTILAKYSPGAGDCHSEHDVLYILVDPNKVSEEDRNALEELRCHAKMEHDREVGAPHFYIFN
jgi:hypothetical protein